MMTSELIQNNPLENPLEGCNYVQADMDVDELIRRLKVLSSQFQGMGQEENASDEYVPLCLHLSEEVFLNHVSKDVKLLVACCIADIIRIYAPEAPYKDSEQVKRIFKFLIGQLEGLKDPNDAAFRRYFYLLENLAFVKAFNLCFEHDEAQEIFCCLFEMIFQIVNDEHSGKVKGFMLDVLCVVSDCDTFSNELLNIILCNIVEPVKSSKKNAYYLAKELIIKCSEPLTPYIQNFFNQVLIYGRGDSDLFITHKVYDLIFELNDICPIVLLSVIPQLEYKLKSCDEVERLGSVSLLARMFAEKESFLALHYAQLWQAFVGRFNDISVSIRIKCVQYSMHLLLNHPELRGNIVDALKMRQHDGEESVRYEVVKSIVATAKLDFAIVGENEDLLNCVKERCLDKKFKIRREALQGLALIYKNYLTADYVPPITQPAVISIKQKILHTYFMTSLDDRILVERLLNTCLVPFQLETEDRMMKLFYLYVTIDENASQAFVEIQKNLLLVRRHVNELLICIRSNETNEDYERQLNIRISQLTKFLPDPVKASEFLCKFSSDLRDDDNLFKTMKAIVSPEETDCKSCAEYTNIVLKKLGPPIMTNLYYNTIKLLLERTSSVLVDKEAILKLLSILHDVVRDNQQVLNAIGCNKQEGISRGLELICVLASVFPAHFNNETCLDLLIQLLNYVANDLQPKILTALTYVGKYSAIGIGTYHENLMGTLVPKCQDMLVVGTPKQGKEAVRCMHVNMKKSARNHTFTQIVAALRENLDPKNANYRTAIVALGHIALLMPEDFKSEMKSIISQKIVKELLVNPKRTEKDKRQNSENWCSEEDLPEITRCMMAGMKCTVRWLLALKSDFISAAKTFKMLTAFVDTGGGFINVKVSFSNAEKAWLRLTAGSCMLKICEQKGVGDQFTAIQFCSLSKLMTDEVLEVRSRFALKLHCGLSRGIPHKCLPLDFMGFYSLAGYETDKKHKSSVRTHMVSDVNNRRDYINTLMITGAEKAAEQLPHIMPDYMLVFSVPVLSHNSRFTTHNDPKQLNEIKDCLWFILEPLIIGNEGYSFAFYKTLVEKMKNHKDALQPENDNANYRMYVICDIALALILQRSTSFEMKEYPSLEPRIPPMYFKRHDDPFYSNAISYLPNAMTISETPKKAAITFSVLSENSKRKKKRESAVVDEHGNVSIDAQPTDASETTLQIPGLKSSESDQEDDEVGPVGNFGPNSSRSVLPTAPVPVPGILVQEPITINSDDSEDHDTEQGASPGNSDVEPPWKSARLDVSKE